MERSNESTLKVELIRSRVPEIARRRVEPPEPRRARPRSGSLNGPLPSLRMKARPRRPLSRFWTNPPESASSQAVIAFRFSRHSVNHWGVLLRLQALDGFSGRAPVGSPLQAIA